MWAIGAGPWVKTNRKTRAPAEAQAPGVTSETGLFLPRRGASCSRKRAGGSGPAPKHGPAHQAPPRKGPAPTRPCPRRSPAPAQLSMLSGRAAPAGLRGRPQLPAPAQPADAASLPRASLQPSCAEAGFRGTSGRAAGTAGGPRRPPEAAKGRAGEADVAGQPGLGEAARAATLGGREAPAGRAPRRGPGLGGPDGRAFPGLLSELSPLPVGRASQASPTPRPQPRSLPGDVYLGCGVRSRRAGGAEFQVRGTSRGAGGRQDVGQGRGRQGERAPPRAAGVRPERECGRRRLRARAPPSSSPQAAARGRRRVLGAGAAGARGRRRAGAWPRAAVPGSGGRAGRGRATGPAPGSWASGEGVGDPRPAGPGAVRVAG